MNTKQLIAIAIVLTASASAFSQPLQRVDQFGDAAPVSAATRTIVITSSTKYVNVTAGETINFIVGDKSFAWTFDGTSHSAFNLERVSPANLINNKIVVYIAPNTLYVA
ncbi:MAG: hypothetical protein ACI83P_000577 [Janthinobacterium sp.]|jgi:hypothetical protein